MIPDVPEWSAQASSIPGPTVTSAALAKTQNACQSQPEPEKLNLARTRDLSKPIACGLRLIRSPSHSLQSAIGEAHVDGTLSDLDWRR